MPTPQTQEALHCYHCGDHCPDEQLQANGHVFCCQGCRTVYELLEEHGLCQYYRLEDNPGIKLDRVADDEAYAYLDEEAVQRKLYAFTDGKMAQLDLYLPQIHCTSCVWLLENLYKLLPGVLSSEVHFGKKQLSVSFDLEQLTLRRLATVLASVGYPPDFRLDATGKKDEASSRIERRLIYQIGLAGFTFGNVMLFAVPEYFDTAGQMEEQYLQLFRWLNLILAFPVFFYSGSSYLTSAWEGLRQKQINMDVPIALGMTALFGRTVYEILSGVGGGYADSLAGFIFFLLIGKFFQQRTYAALSFDRDFKSYFPLTLNRLVDGRTETVMVTEAQIGDTVRIRHGELIPADAYLISDDASIDYSFVTGESEPVAKAKGDYIYAGGRQKGGSIDLVIAKEVSQSSLTQLWNRPVFDKNVKREVSELADKVSHYFTAAVMLISIGAFSYWIQYGWGPALEATTAVLIVACPCALAISLPFTFSTALRVFGRHRFYVKNSSLVEALATIDTIAFDKTGTLTYGKGGSVAFQGQPLNAEEQAWVRALAQQSIHPVSRKIADMVAADARPVSIEGFTESTGLGIQATVDGHLITLGKARWVKGQMQDGQPNSDEEEKGRTCLSIDGQIRGCFDMQQEMRPGLEGLLEGLKQRFQLFLITGDRKAGIKPLQSFFGGFHRMFFEQSPEDKLEFVSKLQGEGHRVAMIGDGLNDAGALKASRFGITITDDVNSFTPASDAILDARELERLPRFLRFARYARQVVMASFVLSLLYNITGISFAVQGLLSPVVSAILMPLSSITVVLFATGMVEWGGRKLKL